MLLKNPKIFVESVTALNRIIRFEGFPIGLDKRDTWAYHEKSQSEKMRNLTTQRACFAICSLFDGCRWSPRDAVYPGRSSAERAIEREVVVGVLAWLEVKKKSCFGFSREARFEEFLPLKDDEQS